VVASGYVEPDVKYRMHEAGVEHFIEKPYKLDKLLETLYGVIAHGCDWPKS
jgi:CheY-like chemotaxis protein